MRKRKRNRKRKKFLPLLLPALLTVLCFFLLEKSLLPPLKEISHMQCRAAANHIIDEAAANALARMELDASALLQKGAWAKLHRQHHMRKPILRPAQPRYHKAAK